MYENLEKATRKPHSIQILTKRYSSLNLLFEPRACSQPGLYMQINYYHCGISLEAAVAEV